MVRRVAEAVVESTRLDFRPGVDGSLHHDGGGRVAGVASRRLRSATPASGVVPRATGAQRTLNAAVLWLAPARSGVCRDRAAVVGHCHDADGLSPREPRRCLAACAIPGVGEFCRGVELHFMAAESLNL